MEAEPDRLRRVLGYLPPDFGVYPNLTAREFLLLIVDEPTAGLDPEERARFRAMLGDLASDRVVILSTHIVSDVEASADDIAIMADGGLLRRGRPSSGSPRWTGAPGKCRAVRGPRGAALAPRRHPRRAHARRRPGAPACR